MPTVSYIGAVDLAITINVAFWRTQITDELTGFIESNIIFYSVIRI